MILHKAPQLYFDFFSDPTTQLGSALQGPNTDSDGCLLFPHRDRDSGSPFIYLYIPTQTPASLSVGLPVCLFACLSVQICLFLCSFVFYSFVFYSTATETRVRHLSNFRCRNRSALASSGHYGESRVQQHSGGHQEQPRLCRQEQGIVSIIQEQAARLPVSLRQGRIRSVSRQGPETIIYSGQHLHRDA